MITRWKVVSFYFTYSQCIVFVLKIGVSSALSHFQLSIIDIINVHILDTTFTEKDNMDMELNEQTFHYD